MKIYSIQSFSGRNIYSHKPVIKVILDLEELYRLPTCSFDGFNDKLLELFPGLKKHYCSLGHEGGFLERLIEGTYMAHVTEHLIIELQSLLGFTVTYGKTRIIKEPSLYYIVYQYENERCGIECAKAAVDIILGLVGQKEINFKAVLDRLSNIAVEAEMGPSTKAIYLEAKERGIPVTRIGNDSLLQLGYGKYSRQISASLSDATSCISADIASNKHLTKQILLDNKLPVPYGDIAYCEDSALAIAESIGYPVVVKPLDGNQGKGVTLNINSEKDLRSACNEAFKYGKSIIVERYILGKDYRILIVGGKVAAVSERIPPSVVGDGIHNITELVEFENINPLRGKDHEKPLTKIKLDNVAKQLLQRNELDENSIPEPGVRILLRENGNISTGGTARDCTEEIHPLNASIAVKAAHAIGLDIAGIDITTEDISLPINQFNGAIIEVNAAPGLRMHIFPTYGQSRNVASDILDMLYPKDQPHSVPIISISGTNGKTTTTRLIRHTFSLAGNKVGMTSTSGVYIGDECVLKGDNTGPVSARLVLSNKEVEVAVLETARGGIVKKGLGYDQADVGVIVNISDDHLGLDGLNTLEDLAFVKALVIEAVKPDGYAVLNADDEMIEFLLGRVKSKVLLFSKNPDNSILKEHIQAGGKAVFTEGSMVFLQHNEERIRLIELGEIPITFGGRVECNIENSLAAISALYALNVPIDNIRLGLKSFRPDVMSNPGRFNVFDMGNFKVMLDYSHNTAGYNAVIKFIEKMDAKRLVGVIGMPGDRMDKNIEEVGKICSKAFSKLYIKEDRDLRGREQGEVAEILCQAVLKTGYRQENLTIINSERKALESAMLDAQPGDLIIMFYEEFEPAFELVKRFKQELEQCSIQPDLAMKEAAG